MTRCEFRLNSSEPRIITFAGGLKSTIKSERFKNETAMNRWLDAHGDDIDLLEVRKEVG